MKIPEIVLGEDLEYVTIYPFADLQIGDPQADTEKAHAYLNIALNDPTGYVVLDGDLMNTATRNSKSDIYAETMPPYEQIEVIVEMLTPLAKANKILCIVDGNHEWRIMRDSGISPTATIAARLRIESKYYPTKAYFKLAFGKRKPGNKRQTYTIQVLHGHGAGATAGGMINKIEKYILSSFADLSIFGHWHNPLSAFPATLYYPDLHNNSIIQYDRQYMVCTGWLNYQDGYAERMMLPPRPIKPNKAVLYAAEKHIEITSNVLI